MPIPAELQASFAEETAERTVLAAQILYGLGIVLFPAFGLLDWVLYPDKLRALLAVRFGLCAYLIPALALLLLLKRRGQAARYCRPLALCMVYPTIVALDLIILACGGAESPYYAGLCLVLLGVMVSMPWGPKEMGAHALVFWLQYAAVMLLFDWPLSDPRAFVGNNFFIVATIIIGLTWSVLGERLRRDEFLARQNLEKEKERSEKLLLNVLPAAVAEELKKHGRVEARDYPVCSIMFSDFVGFTALSSRTKAATLVRSLDRLFRGFDGIAEKHGLEKLKTIGDAYMCAGGIPLPRRTHLVDSVLAALSMMDFLDRDRVGREDGLDWRVRIGIHSGPVTTGVIGHSKFAYDVWGDTVNTAARLESLSEAGRINVTTDTFARLAHLFTGLDRGQIVVKGKGPLSMTFVTGIRPELAADEACRCPNEAFWAVYAERAIGPPSVPITALELP